MRDDAEAERKRLEGWSSSRSVPMARASRRRGALAYFLGPKPASCVGDYVIDVGVTTREG